jgi:hypothetical protein
MAVPGAWGRSRVALTRRRLAVCLALLVVVLSHWGGCGASVSAAGCLNVTREPGCQQQQWDVGPYLRRGDDDRLQFEAARLQKKA